MSNATIHPHSPPTVARVGQRKRLAFIFTTFPPEVTGSALYNWERLQWLARQGNYQILALVPDWPLPHPLPKVPAELAVRLRLVAYPSQAWPIYPLLRSPKQAATPIIEQELAQFHPDLITVLDLERLFWFGTWHLPGRAYARRQQIPYITEYHTDYYSHLGTYLGGKLVRQLIFKPITNRLYRQCDQVLSISPAASQSLQQLGITNRLELPIYGLDFSSFDPNLRDREILLNWLTPDQAQHKILLFVGRLACEKRVDLLIQAYAQLKPSHPDLTLVIAGDGPALTALRQQAQSIADITFTGFVQGETKAKLLAAADLYCSPAPYETFGRTPLEAMAAGVPVVTVDSGGVADYITAGVNGYLVPANQISPLADTLAQALHHDNSSIIANGLRLIASFSLERACQTLTDHYQTLIPQRI